MRWKFLQNVQYIQQPETDTHNTVMELLQLHPNNLPDDLEVNQVVNQIFFCCFVLAHT